MTDQMAPLEIRIGSARRTDTGSTKEHRTLAGLLANNHGRRICVRFHAPIANAAISASELSAAIPADAAVSIVLETLDAADEATGLAGVISTKAMALSVDIPLPAGIKAQYPGATRDTVMAGIVSASEKITATGIRVRWLAPVTAPTLYHLEGLFGLAEDTGVEPVLTAEDRLADLTPNDRLFLADFIRDRVFDDDVCHLDEAQCNYYRALLYAAASERGLTPEISRCVVRICDDGNATSEMVTAPQHSLAGLFLVQEQAGAPSQAPRPRLTEMLSVATDGARGHLHAALAMLCRRKPRPPETAKRVLLIGAYGGEHIGDAAILGGVTFRIHQRYGATDAILMSQRPAHTRHLIPMIETPLTIEVRDYEHQEIKQAIREVDAVVFAGGPLIDLPKQLVRHIYAAALARQAGKPFLMEGIGPGPFPRRPSEFTARRLASFASAITLRTQESADAAVIKGFSCQVGHDPAFDYLATRPQRLTRIAAGEEDQLRHLFEAADGRPVIGLNIRPIYHQYTVAPGEDDKADFTRRVEDQFERRLAAAMNAFNKTSSEKPLYLFFPMNAVQFGLSDLKSAYRIGRHLDPDVDYRVWEADASLDGVLALIRRLDLAVTMRFHATIFALSQGIEILGIDYRVGKRDKVAAVLSDAGKGEQCTRIDLMTTEWLLDHFARFLNQRQIAA
jgi:polysaccharide pyruvyl transferase WcaK-like protein